MKINWRYMAFLRRVWPRYTATVASWCVGDREVRLMLYVTRQRRFRWARYDYRN